jgi:hypothetical protein
MTTFSRAHRPCPKPEGKRQGKIDARQETIVCTQKNRTRISADYADEQGFVYPQKSVESV